MLFLLPGFTVSPVYLQAGEEGSIQTNNNPADLSVSGSNTLRFEHYNTSGDEDASNYQFEGPQTYDQFSLNFKTLRSPYSKLRGQVSGLINESDYRARDRGFVPERLNLTYEKGDIALPFRVEVGDYYLEYSPRTIQRSLKGAQLELQPDIGSSVGRRLSIQFASGARQSRWKQFDFNEDLTNSMSLSFEDSVFGLWNLNYVHNSRKAIRNNGTLHRSQYVVGLAMEKTISVWNQNITFEGELDYFNGDHDGITGAASGRGRDDNAVYIQLRGRSELPLTYRLLFEEYGQDYRPNGAAVSPDRRTGEAHVGWRFDSGISLRGRLQHFKDGVETSNPSDTYTTGITISGPLFKSLVNDLSGSINAYIQDVENRSKSSNSTTQTVSANFSKPLIAGWNGNIDLFYQDVDNHSQTTNDTVTRQVGLGVDHSIRFFGLEGNIRPGILMRQIDNISSGVDDMFPTLAVNLNKGNHRFGYDMGYNIQNRRITSSTDVKTLTQNFIYTYERNNDTFGLEINTGERNPDPGHTSKSVRMAAYWTHLIGRNFRFKRQSKRYLPHTTGTVTSPYPARKWTVDVTDLVPGADINKIRERLAIAGIKGAIEQDNLISYETGLLDEFDQRQRLVLIQKNDILQKAALIIEFDDVGNLDDMEQTFERVLKTLMDRYGIPSNFFQRGGFSENISADVNNGSFIRSFEWSMPDGIIRYGIPRRLDRHVRMEIHYSTDFAPIENNSLWSIERVK